MDLNNIGRDCPCYEFDNSEMSFDIGEFNGLAPNNGKLTVNVNGVEAGEFYANQQEDTTIDIQTVTQQDINNAVSSEATIRERADRDLQANIDGERLARQQADNGLQAQIDAIASKSDVVDVVGTYAELQAYDTSKLDDNDVVKVLDDSTHNGSMTYYRWNETTQTWSYIGQESPYYSKSQTDTLLAQKQDNLTAGTGITLNGSTISADTTVLAEKSELDNYAEKANTYTKTEVDNLVEPKLSVEVAEQLPVQGDQNKLYLTEKSHTTQTATGNPISATITDGAGQIEDFQLDGDTYQQSYSGKNLIDVTFTSETGNGVTKTLNPDGSITLNGHTTAGHSFNIAPAINWEAGTTYAISIEVLGGSFTPYNQNQNWAVRLIYSTNTQGDYVNITTSGGTATYSPSTTPESRVVSLWFGYNSSTTSEMAVFTDFKFRVQVEKGSTPTTYEPFVGGIASPNPSYPQPIQVVTGEQTVSKVGKNLFDKNNANVLNAYFSTTVETMTTNTLNRTLWITCEPNTTYTVQATGSNWVRYIGYTQELPAVGVDVLGTISMPSNTTSASITTGSSARYLVFRFWHQKNSTETYQQALDSIQLEKGSSASSYAPYSKTDYPISLGSIELCKLGTYQDYIYKDGDTWKVHKATGYFDFSGQTSANGINKQSATSLGGFVFGAFVNPIPNYANPLIAYSNYFRVENTNSTWTEYGKMGVGSSGALWFKTIDDTHTDDRTVSQFVAWLRDTPVNLYYALATPTDTAITDTTLISQLNAIASASLETGTNTLTNSATGSNLAGDMEVDYFGYDPTNRYDKWLWLDINNAYEKLGS